MASTRTFKFIEAPPERNMRRKSPESAPRLFEWLVENGYVESITTKGKRSSRRDVISADLNAALVGPGGGRASSGKKKKKKSPF